MPTPPTANPAQFIQGAPILLVPDVLTTVEFYRSKLGFKYDPEGDAPEYTVVWRDNAAVHIAKGGTAPAGVRLFFWVKDVNALHDELTGRGVAIDVPIGTRPYGIRDFSVRDPNGVMVVFGQDWDED
jgi:catechol 2,3-dioxygenase-like lactoylglutathione lyase family enzyme